MVSIEWPARRILRELCSPERRREILTSFWTHGDAASRRMAQAQLAKSLNFREGTLGKLPPEKKADMLAGRLTLAEYEPHFEAALLTFHVVERRELMGAFLDAWGIRHTDGSIEDDEYTVPSRDSVEAAVTTLSERFPAEDVMLYVATAGLVMGQGLPEWRGATWPVVDAHIAAS
jgi:hypothetical protein